MKLQGRRAVSRLHDHRLQAAVRSPVVRAAHPVRAYDPALQSRWLAGGKPVCGEQVQKQRRARGHLLLLKP
eukprot:7347708-Prymnesium_polylepis.1